MRLSRRVVALKLCLRIYQAKLITVKKLTDSGTSLTLLSVMGRLLFCYLPETIYTISIQRKGNDPCYGMGALPYLSF